MVYRPSEGRNQQKQTAPKQPDLVPMMNVFMTLIPFLITMVVVVQVALVGLNFSASRSLVSASMEVTVVCVCDV
jgi:biopolymer transport protein ExbD